MNTFLEWASVTSSRDSRFMVKGVELANAIVPETLCRFQVCEHRAYTAQREPDVIYRVRDAETVSDAQVRDGIRPAIVQSFKTLESALDWCKSQTA